MAAMSDYLENKLIDQLFRGQGYSFPGTLYFALFTSTANDTGGGTEVSGGSYARVAVVASLTNFSGTQGAASVVASSGTSANTSNNIAIVFPSPTANWGLVTDMAVYDASTGGNLLWWNPLVSAKSVNNGDAPPSFQPTAFSCTLDS